VRELKLTRILAYMLVFSCIITSIPFIATPAQAVNEKITTAIVNIDCPATDNMSQRINDALVNYMIKSHRFEVIDGAAVASKMKELKLSAVTNTTQACDLGKALGIGTVTMVQAYGNGCDTKKCWVDMQIQVIDVETGIIIQQALSHGEGYKVNTYELSDEAINNGVMALVNQMNDNLTKVGLVALIKDGNINISLGGDIGIKDNSEYAVYRDNKVIGKLRTKALDSYDSTVERIIMVPGFLLQEGDLVVLAFNQGDEISRNNSPSTIQTNSAKPALILTAILVGAAIALIATNESSQVKEEAKSFYFQSAFETTIPPYNVYLLTVRILDAKGYAVKDGTTVTIKTGSSSGVAYFSTSNTGTPGPVNPLEVYTKNGIATVYVYVPTSTTSSVTINAKSENHSSQDYVLNTY